MIAAVVTGALGQDAEMRVTQNGDAVCNISIASRRYEKGEEHTVWVRCSMFGKRAEAVSKYLTKGTRVAARGALHVREYVHGGEKRHSIELRADDIDLLGGGEKKGAAPSGGGSGKRPGSYGRNEPQQAGSDDYAGATDDGDIPFAFDATIHGRWDRP
jgi:single-strand DNA-binding protein